MFAIDNLHKTFIAPGNVVVNAVDGISLGVDTGKLITLLGPSGCGKTTTLRCLAGLERPEAGRIVIAGETVCDTDKSIFVSPSDRGIGMVFQSYAIWPHMTVFENVAFPLRVARDRKYSSADIKERVERALDMVRMSGFESRPATQLSGGQQQRLAFARGLVREPQILLLDEPLSNLDAKLREQMRVELKRLQKRLGITTVYVTHDQSEALALSDEVAVFNAGRIIQRGTPQDIYRHPKTQFVADFIGSANFLTGKVKEATAVDGVALVETPHGMFRCGFAQTVAPGQSVLVSARPEDFVLSEGKPGDGLNVLAGKIVHRVFLGEVVDYLVDTGEGEIRVRAKPEFDFRVGQPVQVGVSPNKCVALPS
jgi:iron(III) transport system ATP-binding protein